MSSHSSLAPAVLLELLQSHRFGVEYQPLMASGSGNCVGYEALARFYTPDGRSLSPLDVFDALHHSPLSLYQVEYQMKELQLEKAPEAGMLFLNLDPHAASAWGALNQQNPLVRLLCGRPRVVVELIENTSISDAQISQELANCFSAEGALLALDDLGAPGSLLSLPIVVSVDFIKFDRSWTQRLEQQSYRSLMTALVQYARGEGKRTVLEGIETQAQWEQARRLGIDYVQGFLFREAFVQYRPLQLACAAA